MLKITPDELPEVTSDTQFHPDPAFGAKGGKLNDFVGKNVFVTLLTGEFYVGICDRIGDRFTVGRSRPLGDILVESIREV